MVTAWLIITGLILAVALAVALTIIVAKKRRATMVSLVLVAVPAVMVLVLLMMTRAFRDWRLLNDAARLLMLLLGGCVFAGLLGLLWQLVEWLGAADSAGGTVNPEERRRIIGMVEQNKMTAQEGTELLDALGKSSALRGQQTFSRLDIMTLLGIAATIMGFFLPWKWLNMYDGATGLQLHHTGYQVGTIGGVMIGCSVIAAILVFITPRDYLYKLLLMQVLWICVGLAVVASIWLQAGGNVGYGAIICVGGYGVALVGSVMKLRALAR
jgi:hypothetical protein